MDIQRLILFDQDLLLRLNGSDSVFWDGFMWIATSTAIWAPAILVLLYIIFKNNKPSKALLIVVMMGLVIFLADRIASGICKPYFARPRPTHDPVIMYLVDIVNGYRGGAYGFLSSHAANTFSVSMFMSMLVRKRSFTFVMFSWAVIHTFTRIYLGVHYPGDITFGALEGLIVGSLLYLLYNSLQKRLFTETHYSASQYVSEEYPNSDLKLFYVTFILILLAIFLLGIGVAYFKYL